ncbi:hypothetical protein QTP70_026177 [Hemibagrus guttatus]|uniref:Uncharacterized protein n=1 Tax=Hemibagrus guttatus TaxID=175788 RepID=A0AAE0R901_9TELE|nr:hypothetical protein QTP70_026177 [Hemibagrus guttatus]
MTLLSPSRHSCFLCVCVCVCVCVRTLFLCSPTEVVVFRYLLKSSPVLTCAVPQVMCLKYEILQGSSPPPAFTLPHLHHRSETTIVCNYPDIGLGGFLLAVPAVLVVIIMKILRTCKDINKNPVSTRAMQHCDIRDHMTVYCNQNKLHITLIKHHSVTAWTLPQKK